MFHLVVAWRIIWFSRTRAPRSRGWLARRLGGYDVRWVGSVCSLQRLHSARFNILTKIPGAKGGRVARGRFEGKTFQACSRVLPPRPIACRASGWSKVSRSRRRVPPSTTTSTVNSHSPHTRYAREERGGWDHERVTWRTRRFSDVVQLPPRIQLRWISRKEFDGLRDDDDDDDEDHANPRYREFYLPR